MHVAQLDSEHFRGLLGRLALMWLFMACALLVYSKVASGKELYMLTNGQGIGVCEAYVAGINSGPSLNPGCSRKFGSQVANLVIPDGEYGGWSLDSTLAEEYPIDLQELRNNIDWYVWSRDINPLTGIPPRLWPRVLSADAHNRDGFWWYKARMGEFDKVERGRWLTKADIDNDGVVDVLYSQECNTRFGTLLVLKPDLSGVDKEKTEQVLQHPPFDRATSLDRAKSERERTADGLISGTSYRLRYDVFLFDGETFYDLYRKGSGFGEGTISIYQRKHDTTTKTCEIRRDALIAK